jgi:hypothetical protein
VCYCTSHISNAKVYAYNIDVTKLIEPESMHGAGGSPEVPLVKGFVDIRGSNVELMIDPPFNK